MGKAVFVEIPTNAEVIDHTVPDALNISQGSVMMLSAAAGTRGAYPSTTTSVAVPFAGIASVDKEANDGQTELGLYVPGTNSVFEISMAASASGVPSIGEHVEISGADTVRQLLTEISGGSSVGRVIEPGVANTQVEVRI